MYTENRNAQFFSVKILKLLFFVKYFMCNWKILHFASKSITNFSRDRIKIKCFGTYNWRKMWRTTIKESHINNTSLQRFSLNVSHSYKLENLFVALWVAHICKGSTVVTLFWINTLYALINLLIILFQRNNSFICKNFTFSSWLPF